jgi:transcription elongation factor GreB
VDVLIFSMSRAFVREDDIEPEPVATSPASPVGPGEKNYLTPAGAARLRDELTELTKAKLPVPRADADPEFRREFRVQDQRIRYLTESLRTAEIIGPPPLPWEVVRFGATVFVRDQKNVPGTYRIVGIDEADAGRGWVSWRSPIARALLQAGIGAEVPFRFPTGESRLKIETIAYS